MELDEMKPNQLERNGLGWDRIKLKSVESTQSCIQLKQIEPTGIELSRTVLHRIELRQTEYN